MDSTFTQYIKDGNAAAINKALSKDAALASARGADGLSPLLLALYHGHEAIARRLAGMRSDLDVFEAAALGDLDRLTRLIKEDCTCTRGTSPDGFTPLHLAAFFHRSQAVKLLLDSGADANTPAANAMRVTPLHSAAAADDLDAVKALLHAGADANAVQQGGFTALHAAAQNGSAAMVRLLLDYGADPAARTDEGKSVLDFAVSANADEVIRLLQNNA